MAAKVEILSVQLYSRKTRWPAFAIARLQKDVCLSRSSVVLSLCRFGSMIRQLSGSMPCKHPCNLPAILSRLRLACIAFRFQLLRPPNQHWSVRYPLPNSAFFVSWLFFGSGRVEAVRALSTAPRDLFIHGFNTNHEKNIRIFQPPRNQLRELVHALILLPLSYSTTFSLKSHSINGRAFTLCQPQYYLPCMH